MFIVYDCLIWINMVQTMWNFILHLGFNWLWMFNLFNLQNFGESKEFIECRIDKIFNGFYFMLLYQNLSNCKNKWITIKYAEIVLNRALYNYSIKKLNTDSVCVNCNASWTDKPHHRETMMSQEKGITTLHRYL